MRKANVESKHQKQPLKADAGNKCFRHSGLQKQKAKNRKQRRDSNEKSNVSFQYENSERGALHDVSLAVEPGECVLLCGESGCGKTTITRLLNGLIPHFYEGELQGRVSVYGLPVQEEELYTISEKVGSVFQNPRSQFFCLDTTSEVAFGCENMGLPEREIRQQFAF